MDDRYRYLVEHISRWGKASVAHRQVTYDYFI